MRKILLSLVLVVTLCCSGVHGASSEDVYLRRDVFEAKMDAFMAEIRGDIKELSARIDGRIDSLEKEVKSVETNLNKRVDDLHNFFYLIIVLLGLVIAMPFMQKSHNESEVKKEKTVQILTVDDVKKLINEAIMSNNLSLQGK